MEQRSPKLQGKEKKVQTSCLWALVDIFDFRSGRSNQKLLTNGERAVQKDVSDLEHSRKVHTMASCHGKKESFKGGEGLVMHAAAAAADDDPFQESMKNLMKQKFGSTKKSKKQKKSSSKMQLVLNSDIELVNQLQGYQKKHRKPSMEYGQVHRQQRKDKFLLGPDQSPDSAEISLDKHRLQAMCEEICSKVYHQEEISAEVMTERVSIPSKYKELDQINMQLLQIAAKAFIDQIYIDRKHKLKDGESCKSKYFSDALDILNLNMDLFLKLLQDPNSLLLKGGIHNSQFPLMDKERMKFYLDSNPTECRCDGTRNDQDPLNSIKIQKRNSNNPLWKKLKYQCGCSSRENTSSQASNKIVILKPVPTSKKYPEGVSCHCSSRQTHKSLKNKEQIIKSTYFFKDIETKFKQAVGVSQQKQQKISMDESLRRLARNKCLLKDAEKGKSSGSVKGKSVFSPDAMRKEKQLVDLASSNGSKTALSGGTSCESSSSGSFSKQRQIDVSSEAKRHLSARLRNSERGEIVQRKEAPRTLKMILSSPEHDLLTTLSPKRDKNAPTSVQMRHSPYNTHLISTSSFENEEEKERDFPGTLQYIQEVFSPDLTRLDEQLEISESTSEMSHRPQTEAEVLENIYSIKDGHDPNGSADLMANEVVTPKSSNISELPYDLNSVDDDANDSLGTETRKCYKENGYMESSNLTIPLETHSHRPLLGSPRSLNIHGLEIVNTAKYKEEHTSPVSVLEPFSPEYVNSPTSIMNKPDESSLQPRRITFEDCSQVISKEDPKINTNVCIGMEEPLHAHVKEIIEASELSFNNETYLKGPSQQDILYTCIANIVGLYSFESYSELQLVFDCIHEVLLRIYKSYFGYPPWLSFLQQKIRPIPQEKEVIDEVVKEVNFLYLHPKAEQPTLDQLVAQDILKPGSWLDLCLDTEDILIQITEDVLQDSIEDALLEVLI